MDLKNLAENDQQSLGLAVPIARSFEVSANTRKGNRKAQVWAFFEAQTPAGRAYEAFMVLLIAVNVFAFILGSLFDKKYNIDPDTQAFIGPECELCDFLFFGVNTDSETSVLEVISVAVFTIDYLLRLWAVVEVEEYRENRLTFVFSFFSIVDLVSILPFYVDLAVPGNLSPAQFLRIFRLFRMMHVKGRYSESFRLFSDVVKNKKHLLITAGFAGSVVWVIAAGFYYIAERRNPLMIYCPSCPDVDVSKCHIDQWGFVDCSAAKCSDGCWNLFESIPGSMYFTMLNLFGEFPLSDRHCMGGKFVGTIVAVFAVFVFGIPTGIIGSGFSEILEKKRKDAKNDTTPSGDIRDSTSASPDQTSTFRRQVYNIINNKTVAGKYVEYIVSFLIITSTLSFLLETTNFAEQSEIVTRSFNMLEYVTVFLFTIEYLLRVYSISEETAYIGWLGKLRHMTTFFAIVDLASILPFWISLAVGNFYTSTFLRSLRLLRLFKVERYNEAFTVFGDVLRDQSELFIVGGFVALVFWVLFSACMYFFERNNPDEEMMIYYRNIPSAMWITLLNLSGECPLCMYSIAGKVLMGFMGIFAVGIVGVPIGVLSAGFQDWVAARKENTPDAPAANETGTADARLLISEGSRSLRERVRDVLEARNCIGRVVEALTFLLIFATIAIAIIETLPGLRCNEGGISDWCDTFEMVEALVVITFTIEYLLNIYAASSICAFCCSLHAIIDVVSILPWWLTHVYPDKTTWIADNASLFIMLRILRLFKLAKYCPAMTLIDDVIRLKWNSLVVTGIVASILWLICGSLLYMIESQDYMNAIDNVSMQGCTENCYQAMRFHNAFASMFFTFIHLTGDYPIVEYLDLTRLVCFAMVLVAAGLVSIPSGLIADGFSQLVEDKIGTGSASGVWEKAYAKLSNIAPRECSSVHINLLQTKVNKLLNGEKDAIGRLQRGYVSRALNIGILTLIITNVFAVAVGSLPALDRAARSYFEEFERVSVIIFTVEFCLRLFSITKDKEHLYSRCYYLSSFFGIVDILAILPWYVQLVARTTGNTAFDYAAICRVIRLFRLLELERFVIAFTILDNVFRRSSGVFVASGLMAFSIWVSSAALYYIFERHNPNWCYQWAQPDCDIHWTTTCTCTSAVYFDSIPDALYITAIFLCGEWAVVDFTIPGKILTFLLCFVGIAIYAIPMGTLFDSFGSVLEGGLGALDENDDGDA